MAFRLTGLRAEKFEHLFHRSDAELKALGAVRLNAQLGYPCRVTLEDAIPGENVLLVHYEHIGAPSAYRSAGPIFIREAVLPTGTIENQIPDAMRDRLYSVRAYDEYGWMLDADVGLGKDLAGLFDRFLADPQVHFLHLHHARRGCFASRVDRA